MNSPQLSGAANPALVAVVPLARPLAQEALDVGDQLVALREACLVDEPLEPFDVSLGVLVGGGGGVQQVASLQRAGRELADRRLDPQVPAERRQQAIDAAGYVALT